jgi:hypothetical protein
VHPFRDGPADSGADVPGTGRGPHRKGAKVGNREEEQDKEWRSTKLSGGMRATHNAAMSINIEIGHRRRCLNGHTSPHSKPMQGYSCEWPDCDKTYKKAADLERHERIREHDDHNPAGRPSLTHLSFLTSRIRLTPRRHRRAQVHLQSVRQALCQKRRPLEAPRTDPRRAGANHRPPSQVVSTSLRSASCGKCDDVLTSPLLAPPAPTYGSSATV